MTIITIDGNIGSGKTYILNFLHRNYNLPIDLEPVESWNNFLEKMYNDNLDIFKFQVKIWLDRCWIQENNENNYMIVERSPFFIKNAFIKIAYKNKMINEEEYNMLLNLHKKTDYLWSMNKYIYLRSSPEKCMQRIKKRNRSSEKNITVDYISSLHDFHEKTYIKALENKMNINVIDVDNKTIHEIIYEIMQLIN